MSSAAPAAVEEPPGAPDETAAEPAEVTGPEPPEPLGPDAKIHERMVRILAELPAIGKDQKNEQQDFMYRGYDDVLNALNPLMGQHGVYLVPDVIERVPGERTVRSGATMYEVNLHVRFRFYGLAGDYIDASGWGEGTDMADKATNKAMTGALKYVLFQIFAISTAEASDSDSTTPEQSRRGASGGGAPVEEGFPTPRGWPAVKEAIANGYGVETWPIFETLIEQVSAHLYSKTDSAELTQEEKLEVLRKVAGATKAIRDAVPTEPEPEAEALLAAMIDAFAGVLDGHRLPGPPAETTGAPPEDDIPF